MSETPSASSVAEPRQPLESWDSKDSCCLKLQSLGVIFLIALDTQKKWLIWIVGLRVLTLVFYIFQDFYSDH